MERIRGTRWKGNDGAQGPAADEFRADAAAGGAEGERGRQQHDGVAAGLQVREGVLHPGQFGLEARRDPVRPPRVVGQLVVTPVAVGERRVAQDGVHGDVGEGIGAQAVADADHRLGLGCGDQQPDRGALALDGE